MQWHDWIQKNEQKSSDDASWSADQGLLVSLKNSPKFLFPIFAWRFPLARGQMFVFWPTSLTVSLFLCCLVGLCVRLHPGSLEFTDHPSCQASSLRSALGSQPGLTPSQAACDVGERRTGGWRAGQRAGSLAGIILHPIEQSEFERRNGLTEHGVFFFFF